MMTASSSHHAACARSSAKRWLAAASFAVVATMSAPELLASRAIAADDSIRLAHLSEENLPAQEMPSVVATPGAGPASDWVQVPNSSSITSAPAAPAAAPAGSPAPPSEAQLEPTPMPTPTEIAPLEVGSVAPQMQISDSSLQGVIESVRATNPALAAALRITDQAREQILNHHEDDAIETLGRAISIDGSNAYAYFYFGRAYLAKKNYEQAITFFKLAEIRFGANPEWLGETLAFEGLANEQAGQAAGAIACYQKALVAVPGNLMARVGLTRLGGDLSAPAVQPVSAPDAGAPPAPEGGAIAPPPNSPPPPPAN